MSWLGFFYGGNIGGAVVGSLLAGFYLLRVYDMAMATYVAVALNVLVARASRWPWPRATPHEAAASARRRARSRRRRARWAVYVAIALSGMTALAREVIWTRMLSLLFGATVYTFSLILAVFLSASASAAASARRSARGVDAPARRARLVPDAAVRARWPGPPTC